MKKIMLTILLSGVFISSAISPGLAGDLVPFSDEELKSFLSDKSYPIGGKTLGKSKGAFYFHSDGTLDALWKGKKETTTWKVEGDSKFCYTLKMFGERECLRLVKDAKTGGYVQFYGKKKRKMEKNSIVSGKKF